MLVLRYIKKIIINKWWQTIHFENNSPVTCWRGEEKKSKLVLTVTNEKVCLSIDIFKKEKTDVKQFPGGVTRWFPPPKASVQEMRSKLVHTVADEGVCLCSEVIRRRLPAQRNETEHKQYIQQRSEWLPLRCKHVNKQDQARCGMKIGSVCSI